MHAQLPCHQAAAPAPASSSPAHSLEPSPPPQASAQMTWQMLSAPLWVSGCRMAPPIPGVTAAAAAPAGAGATPHAAHPPPSKPLLSFFTPTRPSIHPPPTHTHPLNTGAKAITMKQALLIASICEFGGAVLLGAGKCRAQPCAPVAMRTSAAPPSQCHRHFCRRRPALDSLQPPTRGAFLDAPPPRPGQHHP